MNKIVLIIPVILLLLNGCASTYIVHQDSSSIVVCCPSQKLTCSRSEIFDLAKKNCTDPHMIEGGIV